MSSIVSDFIINPVLRQARRFSEVSRTTLTGDVDETTAGQGPSDAVSDSESAEAPARDTMHPPAPSSPRPLSSSTQDTRVEEAPSTPVIVEEVTLDHLGFPLSPRKTRGIPEDDGMQDLRRRILAINALDIPSTDKAKLMHDTLLEGYRASQAASKRRVSGSDGSPGPTWEQAAPQGTLESLMFWQNQLGDGPDKFVLSESDIAPTFAPIRPPKTPRDGSSSPRSRSTSQPSTPPDMPAPLGCQHYERNVKLQCFTCKKWYTCRFCHDEHEDHNLVRNETRNMLCMLCATPQRASEVCINCGEISAQYYCGICKLWENRQSKPIYHCNDCGICRRGMGLGKDFFHCQTCRACITTSIESSHKCIERSTDCDCPICGEYMFTSTKPVVFMPCGHSIHKKCYDQHMKVSYKCPLCNKSLANMETQFRNLDIAIQTQPMPTEFRDTKAVVLCNDCSGRSTVSYHWLGLKCSICRSYNTVELQILGGNHDELQQAAAERAVAALETDTLQTSDLGQQSTSTAPRSVAAVANRRRHSSHGVELQPRMLERVARSLSPLSLNNDALMAHSGPDTDSEDDMLGFWGGRGGDDGSDYSEETDSDDSHDTPEQDDDDDDDDDMVLIGHR